MISAKQARKISEEGQGQDLRVELDRINVLVKKAAKDRQTSITLKDIALDVKAELKREGYSLHYHVDVRQPQDDHYTLSWADA